MKSNLFILLLVIGAIAMSYGLGHETASLKHEADMQEIIVNLRQECNAGQIGGIDCQAWAEGFMPKAP